MYHLFARSFVIIPGVIYYPSSAWFLTRIVSLAHSYNRNMGLHQCHVWRLHSPPTRATFRQQGENDLRKSILGTTHKMNCDSFVCCQCFPRCFFFYTWTLFEEANVAVCAHGIACMLAQTRCREVHQVLRENTAPVPNAWHIASTLAALVLHGFRSLKSSTVGYRPSSPTT